MIVKLEDLLFVDECNKKHNIYWEDKGENLSSLFWIFLYKVNKIIMTCGETQVIFD